MFSLRRHRQSRPISWTQLEVHHSVDSMSIASSSASSRPRTRDTGFPEPFCGSESHHASKSVSKALTHGLDRNTTLPHPDADTSPNACISQDDISVTRVLTRQRRSFLAKHKRITSHGIITPEMQMYNENNVSLVMISESESSSGLTSAQLATISGTPVVGHSARPQSKGDGESLASASTSEHNDGAPKSPTDRHPFRRRLSSDTNESKPNRRRSLISKLGIHRHHD